MDLPDPSAVKAALAAARNRYPSAKITEDQMGEILNTVALQFPHMGMHRKDGQAKQPGTGIGISHDVLRYLPPGDPPPSGSLTEADVRRIIGEELADVRRFIREELAKPRAVALKSPLGQYVSEDRNHTETPDGSPALLANRSTAGPWETFTLEQK